MKVASTFIQAIHIWEQRLMALLSVTAVIGKVFWKLSVHSV